MECSCSMQRCISLLHQNFAHDLPWDAAAEYFEHKPEGKATRGQAMNVICWLVAHFKERKHLN